jgi:hypothetical protein
VSYGLHPPDRCNQSIGLDSDVRARPRTAGPGVADAPVKSPIGSRAASG